MRAIIFDCFGVLIGKGFDNTYRLAGGDPVADRKFIESILLSANLGEITDDEFHMQLSKHLDMKLDEWIDTTVKAERLNVDLLTFIKSLRMKYKTAILSNANNGVIEKKIGKKWLDESFDEIVISAKEGMIKPEPKLYETTCDRLGVKPKDCVYIDDRQIFVDVAESLGMKAHKFTTNEELKEYLKVLLA